MYWTKPCHGESVRAGTSGTLALGQHLPVDVVLADLDHERPGAKALALWDVLARRQDQPARRLSRPQRPIDAHPIAAGVVALRAKDTVSTMVQPLDLVRAAPWGEVVDDDQRVLPIEEQTLQRVVGASP